MKHAASPALALVLLFLLTPVAGAQLLPAEFIEVLTVTVKPEAVSEYEEFVKKIVAAANKVGSPQSALAYQVIFGGSGSVYSFVFPFNKWEDVDRWIPVSQMLSKAYGDAEGRKILKSGLNAVAGSESAVFRLLENLSTRPRAFDPATSSFVFLVRTEIEPEMAPAYEQYLAKLKTAQEQIPDSPTAVRRVSVQGMAYTYNTASFLSKFAERDRWLQPLDVLRRAYGDTEGRSLWESGLRYVRKREFLMLAYRPDLSKPPVSPPHSGQ